MKHVLVYGMTNNSGGIETYLLNFFRRVQGNDVLLDFVSDFPSVSGSEMLISHGAAIYHIPAKSRDLKGHLAGMWKILRKHPEYRSVYFNILDAGAVITMIPAFLAGRKIIVHSHNNSTEKVRLHRVCKPILNLLAGGRAACSVSAAEYMFGKFSDKTLIVPNAIDVKAFAYTREARERKRKELGIGDRLCLIHVGRISHQKNPFGLIDIFEAVHHKNPETVLLSVGNGELMEKFRQYIAEKELSQSVICLGVRNDVPDLYCAADVFLLPSFYEGLGIVVLEAQAAGLPCVISDTIPEDVSVTPLVKRLLLDSSADVWAREILSHINAVREDTSSLLFEAGWDISQCETFDCQLISMFN